MNANPKKLKNRLSKRWRDVTQAVDATDHSVNQITHKKQYEGVSDCLAAERKARRRHLSARCAWIAYVAVRDFIQLVSLAVTEEPEPVAETPKTPELPKAAGPFEYPQVRRACYYYDGELLICVPICKACGAEVMPDQRVSLAQLEDEEPSATCAKCGRVAMAFEGTKWTC